MTYNHSLYIIDAMNGFVMQQTNFPFVCTIVDDASTDGEPEVIKRYLKDNLDWEDTSVAYEDKREYGQVFFARHKTNRNCFFAVVLLKENQFSQNKSKAPFFEEWADTKYVAICEGDDYWTDSLKLQKQVDYLEANPDCTLTVHAANWLSEGRIFPYGCQEPSPKDYSTEELILCGGYFFATASFVFRRELLLNLPEWRRKARVGDYPLQIQAGLLGRVHYLPDIMCVYRYMHEGSWSHDRLRKEKKMSSHKNMIEWMTLLDEATGHRYQHAIYEMLFPPYNALFNNREVGFWEYVKVVGRMKPKRYGRLLKDALRMYLTPVYSFLTRWKKPTEHVG